MTFLEASKIISEAQFRHSRAICLCMSGNGTPLELYMRAQGALRGINLDTTFLEFGTLRQHLQNFGNNHKEETFILFPWDLVGCLDWRLGVSAKTESVSACAEQAGKNLRIILDRNPCEIFYVPAPTPPYFSDKYDSLTLDYLLLSIISENRISKMSDKYFDLRTYLSIGCPFNLSFLDLVASEIFDSLSTVNQQRKKVLVTDLDDTLWSGILADLDIHGIDASPEAGGYRHFLYQSYLKKLKAEGVLIVACSKNDPHLVNSALDSGKFLLSRNEFVGVWANYKSKSVNLSEISKKLNITPGDFVFIDDNPVELAEVRSRFPEVECIQFPSEENGLQVFFQSLQKAFSTASISNEDRQRTELYQKMEDAPVNCRFEEFLEDLRMELTVHDRSFGSKDRVLQLINKTNQFNLNGKRWQEFEIQKEIDNGSRLFGASLADRNGEHGEIVALLISADGTIKSFVMSCRVFQRKIENIFILQILKFVNGNLCLKAQQTERNEPFFNFLADQASINNRQYVINRDEFISKNRQFEKYFKIHIKN